jgi:hypothetical protein
MKTYSRHFVPLVDYRVRRRRYGADAIWLIRKNEWYEIDEFTDHLWLCCERGMTLEETVQFMANAHSLPLNEALAAVVFSLLRFEHLGLVESTEETAQRGAGICS